jgi:uncharacterized protein with HEPN domain
MHRDKAYLQDILSAGKRIGSKITGIDQAAFLSDEDLQDIVMRQITVMGEAARTLSDATKERFSDIPWYKISGMRNRLVHEYRDIDYEEVWKTVSVSIPELLIQIERVMVEL